MVSQEIEPFKRPFQDAILWCAQLPFASQYGDSQQVLHRRTRLDDANRLWNEARQVAKSGWRKGNIQDTEQWEAAQRIWDEVVASSRPIICELRSPQLRPGLPVDRYPSESDLSNAVNELVVKRARLLKQEWTELASEYAEGGRLLLYLPQENLADGAAQVSSGGFYDDDNVPPWDIWVGFSQGALISWVPPALIEVAQMGIDANPENCIRWADQ